MRRDMYGRAQVILALAKPAPDVFVPTQHGAVSSRWNSRSSIRNIATCPTTNSRAPRGAWRPPTRSPNGCMHGANCNRCRVRRGRARCDAASSRRGCPRVGVLERVLERHEHRFDKSDRGMRAVKAIAEDGTKWWAYGTRKAAPGGADASRRSEAARDDQESAEASGKEGGGGGAWTRDETAPLSAARGFAWRHPRPWIPSVFDAPCARQRPCSRFSQTDDVTTCDGSRADPSRRTERNQNQNQRRERRKRRERRERRWVFGGEARASNATRAGTRAETRRRPTPFLRAGTERTPALARRRFQGGTHHVFHLSARVSRTTALNTEINAHIVSA